MLRAQFAATACTIVSGAIAERARVEAYIIYSFFMAAWVYPVIIHSIWAGAGWASMFRWGPRSSARWLVLHRPHPACMPLAIPVLMQVCCET